MTSKNLYFKLIRENIKSRIWAFALISLGFFFLFPVSAAFAAGTLKDAEDAAKALIDYQNDLQFLVGFRSILTAFGICTSAVICGMSSFSYLYSRSKVDFYHSLPIRRETFYLANYISGILILALPYAVSLILAAVIGAANGADAGILFLTAAKGYLLNMIYFILMYSTVIIAVMLTGHIVISFLGTMVFAGYIPMAGAIAREYFSSFFRTYSSLSGEIFEKLALHGSPLTEYAYCINQYTNRESVWGSAAASLLFAIVLMAVGCILYRRRPSEAAGKAIAFSISKPVVRCLICVLSAMTLGLMFWSMRESTGWALFGIICGSVISHCVVEIIYHFDFRKLFQNRLQLLICTLASAAVLCIFRYDLTGYDRYLPSDSQTASAAIWIDALDNWTSRGQIQQTEQGYYIWKDPENRTEILSGMQQADAAAVREIAAEGIRQTLQTKTQDSETAPADPTADLWNGPTCITVCYTLQSGRKVYRSYTMLLNYVIPQMDRLLENPQFMKNHYPLMNRSADSSAAVLYRELEQETKLDSLSDTDRALLLETYQQEFSALTMDTMRTEFPVGLIKFSTPEMEEALTWWDSNPEAKSGGIYLKNYGYISRYDLEIRDFYPVYPSFTKTLALLQAQGLTPGEILDHRQLISADIYRYSVDDDSESTNFSITDPEELHELSGILKDSERCYYNPLFSAETTISIELRYREINDANGQRSKEYCRSMVFPRGQVPEFVTEELQNQSKKRLENTEEET